jgi:DNA-binding response OmpR family regulator
MQVSFVALAARLQVLVRQGARARPVVLTAGKLAVDPIDRRVTRGDEQIKVTGIAG